MTGRAYYGRRSEKPSAAGLRHRLPKEAAAIEGSDHGGLTLSASQGQAGVPPLAMP